MTLEELIEGIEDPMWRIRNLYRIRLIDGRVVDFVPRPFQEYLAKRILVDGHKSFLIPKSRRQGASTVIGVVMADLAAFNPGVNAAIIDITLEDAKDKINNIVNLALASLIEKTTIDGEAMFRFAPGRETSGVLRVEMLLDGKPQDKSQCVGGKRFRGGTAAMIHVSEIGAIANSEPARAASIISGALPAAEGGIKILETTVRGGRSGIFFNLVSEARKRGVVTPDSWEVLFLPWHEDDKCRIPCPASYVFRKETQDYFVRLRRLNGVRCDRDQMLFWENRRAELGAMMFEEYPSTLDEAFDTPMGGAILAKALTDLEMAGRRGTVDRNETVPLLATWDLGLSQNTVCTVFQYLKDGDGGGRVHVLGAMTGEEGETPAERVNRVAETFGEIDVNIFPHDSIHQKYSGQDSQIELWTKAGLNNITALTRPNDVWVGINHLCVMLRSCMWVERDATEYAWGMWNKYRSSPQAKADGKFTNKIVHDDASHWADSLRMIAEAELEGLLDIAGVLAAEEHETQVTYGNYKPAGRLVAKKESTAPTYGGFNARGSGVVRWGAPSYRRE